MPSIWLCCHCNWVRWNVELETSDVLQVVVVVWTNSLTAMSVTRASLFLFLVPIIPEFEFFLWYFLWRRWCFFLALIVVAGVDTQPPIITTQLTNLSANCWWTPCKDVNFDWNSRNYVYLEHEQEKLEISEYTIPYNNIFSEISQSRVWEGVAYADLFLWR